MPLLEEASNLREAGENTVIASCYTDLRGMKIIWLRAGTNDRDIRQKSLVKSLASRSVTCIAAAAKITLATLTMLMPSTRKRRSYRSWFVEASVASLSSPRRHLRRGNTGDAGA